MRRDRRPHGNAASVSSHEQAAWTTITATLLSCDRFRIHADARIRYGDGDVLARDDLAVSGDIRLVDVGRAPVLGARLLVWNLESAGGTRLVGAVEFQITGIDQVVHTEVLKASEPVSAELPGDLAAVAGRLLRRLASEGLTCVSKYERPQSARSVP